MSQITKELKRTIVMLLVCSLVTCLIPMNTYATEDVTCHDVEVVTAENPTDEVTRKVGEIAKGTKEDDTAVSGNTVSENMLACEKDTTVEINVKEVEYYTVTLSQNVLDKEEVVGVVYGDHVRGHEGVNYLTKGEELRITLANFDEAKYEVKSVTIKIDGKKLNTKDYSVKDTTYTISKEKITGDVVVDVITAAK